LEKELDPSVKDFAKSDLPKCAAGQVLSVASGKLSCVADTKGLEKELDPSVKDFAKSDLPKCAAGQVLGVASGKLACVTDAKGLEKETDPLVKAFAKTDLPECGAGQFLRAKNGKLECVQDWFDLKCNEGISPVMKSGVWACADCPAGKLFDSTTKQCVFENSGTYNSAWIDTGGCYGDNLQVKLTRSLSTNRTGYYYKVVWQAQVDYNTLSHSGGINPGSTYTDDISFGRDSQGIRIVVPNDLTSDVLVYGNNCKGGAANTLYLSIKNGSFK
jgi:hypothetical protein